MKCQRGGHPVSWGGSCLSALLGPRRGGVYPIYLVALLLCLYSSDLSLRTQGNKGTLTAGWTCPGGGDVTHAPITSSRPKERCG